MKQWYLGLDPRERRVLTMGAVVVLALFVYLAVIEPISSGLFARQQAVAEQQRALVWMREAASEVKRLAVSPTLVRPTRGQSLLGLIDRTAKQGGLGKTIKRVKPDGDFKVRVWLERASFDQVIHWLEALETNHGVRVSSVIFDRKDTPGLVDVRLVFLGS